MANYRNVLKDIQWHIKRVNADNITSTEKEYYPNGRLKKLYHNGQFNGVGIQVSTDSIFYQTGALWQTVYHDNFKDKQEQGGHATWIVLEKQEFYKSGKLKLLGFIKTCYECGECDCGRWIWFNEKEEIIKQKQYGSCYDQQPCTD